CYCSICTTWSFSYIYTLSLHDALPIFAYDYMCCDDAEIFRTHTLDGSVSMPECATMAYNYYVVNGMYYESYDPQMIMDAMNARADRKSTRLNSSHVSISYAVFCLKKKT